MYCIYSAIVVIYTCYKPFLVLLNSWVAILCLLYIPALLTLGSSKQALNCSYHLNTMKKLKVFDSILRTWFSAKKAVFMLWSKLGQIALCKVWGGKNRSWNFYLYECFMYSYFMYSLTNSLYRHIKINLEPQRALEIVFCPWTELLCYNHI